MASLCLPNSELHVGVDWRGSSVVIRALSDPARPPMLLYPGEGGIDVLTNPPLGPITLVVVDGTWPQTRKMLRHNPQLADLPRLSFDPPSPGQYRVRREPNRHCVSTIEALAYALGALERDQARFLRLLVPFQAMVSRQMACCRELHEGRLRHSKPKPSRVDPRLSLLRTRSSDLVCVIGEANAWPYGCERGSQPHELVQWVACRIRTGEVFDARAAPSEPLSPGTPAHIGLSRQTLESSPSLSDLLRDWHRFLGPSDVVCSWGRYATSLLVASGGELPRLRIDLRRLSKDLMQRRFGPVESFGEALGVAPPPALASGRAGLRLAQLVAVARYWNNPIESAHSVCRLNGTRPDNNPGG
jgi:hypothetical protein